MNDYSLRTELTGNTNTHEFILRIIKYNVDGYQMSLMGKGISKGSGNYFLFKMKDNELLNTVAKYFSFPADADEDTLRAMDDAGSDTPDVNCLVYQDCS